MKIWTLFCAAITLKIFHFAHYLHFEELIGIVHSLSPGKFFLNVDLSLTTWKSNWSSTLLGGSFFFFDPHSILSYMPARQVLSVRLLEESSEVSLMSWFPNKLPHQLGLCDKIFQGCQVWHWEEERVAQGKNKLTHIYSNCFQQAAVELPMYYFGRDVGSAVPEFHENLSKSTD